VLNLWLDVQQSTEVERLGAGLVLHHLTNMARHRGSRGCGHQLASRGEHGGDSAVRSRGRQGGGVRGAEVTMEQSVATARMSWRRRRGDGVCGL
jgi:hypothetical protein